MQLFMLTGSFYSTDVKHQYGIRDRLSDLQGH